MWAVPTHYNGVQTRGVTFLTTWTHASFRRLSQSSTAINDITASSVINPRTCPAAAPAVAAIASLAPTLRSLELYGSALGRLMQPPQRLAGLSALTALTKLVLHLPSDFQSDSTNETNIADLDLLDTGQQSRMESQQASTPGAAPSAGVVSAAAAAAVQVAVRRRLLLPHGLWTSKLNEGALGQTAAAAAGVAVWWGDEWGAEQGPVHALESEVLRRSVRWWSCGILGPPLCGLTELDLGQQGNLGVADLWAVATVAGQLTRLVVRGVDVRQGAAYNRRLDPGGGSGGGGGALGAVVGLGEAPEPRMMMAFPAPPPMAFPPRLREVKVRTVCCMLYVKGMGETQSSGLHR